MSSVSGACKWRCCHYKWNPVWLNCNVFLSCWFLTRWWCYNYLSGKPKMERNIAILQTERYLSYFKTMYIHYLFMLRHSQMVLLLWVYFNCDVCDSSCVSVILFSIVHNTMDWFWISVIYSFCNDLYSNPLHGKHLNKRSTEHDQICFFKYYPSFWYIYMWQVRVEWYTI